jgi:hypothetical protein
LVDEFRVQDGETSIAFAHEMGGGVARATLTEDCDTSDATEEFSGRENTRLFVTLSQVGEDSLIGTDYYTFAGGCVTYSFELRGEGIGALHAEARSALDFTPRSSVEAGVEAETDFEF